jgi:hypothetical protein
VTAQSLAKKRASEFFGKEINILSFFVISLNMEKERKQNYKIICVKAPKWAAHLLKAFHKNKSDKEQQ